MNTVDTPRPEGTTRAGARQWTRASRSYFAVYAFLWTWMWAIALPAAAVAMIIVDRVATVDTSILQFVRSGPAVWMLFSVAIIVTASYLPVHVANGMTRRSVIRGALMAAVLGSLLFGVAMGLAMLAEGAVYDALGWAQDTVAGDDGAAGVWQVGIVPMLLDYVLACLGGAVSGLLVGIVYYRAGGWWGTLTLPLTVLPALAVTFIAGGVQATLGSLVLPAAVTHVVPAVLILAAALAFGLLARSVPIDRTES